MKKLMYLLTIFPFLIFGQTGAQKQIDSLKFISEMPYICEGQLELHHNLPVNCGDLLYWKVVVLKDQAIPLLMDKLDDTTATEAIIPYFGYRYTTADIAYTALEEIIHNIPTFKLLGTKFDKKGCGYCSYWRHLYKSFKNRQKFKEAVIKWYEKNKTNLVWTGSNDFASCDCRGQHPNGGHYELKNN